MKSDPTVGVTFSSYIREKHKQAYLDALEAARLSTTQLYPQQERLDLRRLNLDGLILAGGGDLYPSFYGETDRHCRYVDESRDRLEQELFAWARGKGVPVLGVCRGIQVINVFLGGTLYQDLTLEKDPPLLVHAVPLGDTGYRHAIRVSEGAKMASSVSSTRVWVNSHHHQAVKRVADTLEVVGWTEDGVVEGVEARGEPVFGVQWHPELLGPEGQMLLTWFRQLCCQT